MQRAAHEKLLRLCLASASFSALQGSFFALVRCSKFGTYTVFSGVFLFFFFFRLGRLSVKGATNVERQQIAPDRELKSYLHVYSNA